MRKLVIDGHVADIAAGTVIELKLRSSLLQFSKLQGSFSLSFKLPYRRSPRNTVIFAHSGNPSRGDRSEKQYRAELYFSGHLICSGKLTAQGFGSDVDCAILCGNGEFNDDFAEKKITELAWGNGTGDNGWKQARRHYPQSGWTLPFANNSRPGKSDYLNAYKSSYLVRDTKLPAHYSDVMSLYFPLVPMLYVPYAVRRFIELTGRGRGKFELTGYDDAVLLSFFDIAQKHTSTQGSTVTVEFKPPTVFDLKKCLPEISVKDFVLGIENFFNVKFLFRDGRADVISRRKLLEKEAGRSFTVTDLSLSVKKGKGYKYRYTVDRDDAGYERWQDMGSDGRKRVYLNFQPSGKPVKGQMDSKLYIDPNGRFYEKEKDPKDMGRISYKFLSTFSLQPIGEPEGEEIPVPLTPWGMDNFRTAPSGISSAKMAAEFEEKDTFKNFRVGFVVDNSRQQDLETENAKYCTFNNNKGGKTPVFEREWSDFLHWLNEYAEEVTGYVADRSQGSFLLNLDFSEKYSDRDGQNYILEEVVVPVHHDRIGRIKFSGRTVW